MQTVVGYLLILVGIGMEVVSVLVWLGVLKPPIDAKSLRAVSFWDVLLELARRAPWAICMTHPGLPTATIVAPVAMM